MAYAAIRDAEKDTTPVFQVLGRHIGKVVDAYDGDTCRVAIAAPSWGREDPADAVRYLNVRMLGYDAPEMKKEQLPYGREVKAVFHALVLNKVVIIDIPVPGEPDPYGRAAPDRPDPYGRVLGHMYVAPRGATLSLPRAADPPPRGRLRRLMARLGRRRPERGALEAVVLADDEGVDAPGAADVVVRKQAVQVPITVDIPDGCVADDDTLAGLLHVNQWMIDHGRVKSYDGKTGRADWTADELENGV